jgi:hypothetical protein
LAINLSISSFNFTYLFSNLSLSYFVTLTLLYVPDWLQHSFVINKKNLFLKSEMPYAKTTRLSKKQTRSVDILPFSPGWLCSWVVGAGHGKELVVAAEWGQQLDATSRKQLQQVEEAT